MDHAMVNRNGPKQQHQNNKPTVNDPKEPTETCEQ